MSSASEAAPGVARPVWLWRGMRLIAAIVLTYLVCLGVTTGLRAVFPWDLYVWPESPFMTNMLKLDQGLPVFSSPEDANSFIYSPGLECLCFALLKPLGLQLDIRFCRAVNIGLGLLAGVLAGFCFLKALSRLAPEFSPTRFCQLGAGVAILVIFRNFTADIAHPDNLVMLHTVSLFLMTLVTLEKRSFGWAMVTMGFAGLGVFAKQILMVSFLGPALVFARHLPCSRSKRALLAALGALASLAAIAVLWREPLARFYTSTVLSRQGLHAAQLYWIAMESLHADRAILWVLGVAGALLLWTAGSEGRRFLEIWLCLGLFSVWPNGVSYLKQMGTWNNLVIFQLWLLLLFWPALGWRLSGRKAASASKEVRVEAGLFDTLVAVLSVLFVLLLFPMRSPPSHAMYAACEAVQQRVDSDIRAGRKVLIAHGTMYQLRAGLHQVPLDRANSYLELAMAGLADRTLTAARIQSAYYDRIYLTMPEWYGPQVLAELERHYVQVDVVPKPAGSDRIELGRSLGLIGECRIFSRR